MSLQITQQLDAKNKSFQKTYKGAIRKLIYF